MANPAELLFNLLTSWNSSSSAANARKDSGSLENHRHAVRYLAEIDQILHSMENDGKRTNSFRRAYPEWVKTVFCYPKDWAHVETGPVSQSSRDVLEGLIDYADMYLPKVDEEKFDTLKAYLETVETALLEDDSLSDVVKSSCRSLIQNLRTIVDNYSVHGSFELDQCLQNLLGNLALITLRSRARSKWQTILNTFVFPYAVGSVPAIEPGGIIHALTQ